MSNRVPSVLFSPGIALLVRISGPIRFWFLASPLLIAIVGLTFLCLASIDGFALRSTELDLVGYSGIAKVLFVGSAGIAVWLYLVMSFFRCNEVERELIDNVMTLAAGGNLTGTTVLNRNDSLGRFDQGLELLVDRISGMVADIRWLAVALTDTGSKLVKGAEELSKRAQSQGEHLSHTTSQVRKVSDTVAKNAQASQEISMMTESLHKEASGASSKMESVVRILAPLQSASDRMSEIVGTIDGIAFQTNILALNAAVEAARAGEQGRGFAVVASEVRRLAARSQSAAAEVRQLITASSELISTTVTEVQCVNELMESLVSGIKEITLNVAVVADGSARQSSALEILVHSVGDLDTLANENSVLVSNSAIYSDRLIDQAAKLGMSVRNFTLRQGTADEARHIVIDALTFIQGSGLQAGLRALQTEEKLFQKKDLYVFVFDRQGVYRAFGIDSEMVGKTVYDIKGLNGGYVLAESWRICDAEGGGWLNYAIANPRTGELRNKSSFVRAIDENHLLGCGCYINQSDLIEELV